jgi:hypothetical protein
MIRRILCTGFALVASVAVVAHADPKDDVTGAIAKLDAAPNYTYVSTTQGRGGPQVTTVKIQKDGYTYTSRDFNGTPIETYAKGTVTVFKNQDGAWMTAAEMAAAGGGGGGGRGRGRGFGAAPAPAVELKAWEDKLSNFAAADGAITADVDPDFAKTLVPAGRGRRGGGGGGGGGAPPAAPVLKDVKATVKFTLADGNIAKYEAHVTGTRTVNDQDMPIDNTTSTEIKDIGTTTFDVPADAKAKLDAPPAPPAQ